MILAVVLLSLLVAGPANGQLLQGSLTGIVLDPTNATVPDAEVSILHTLTGHSRTTLTNGAGQYSFPTVDTGTYDVTVTKDGFRALVQEGVEVSINNVTRVDVTLQLGQITEQITVTTDAATLQTDRAEVRRELPSKSIENLPMPLGRSYQMLLLYVPGVSATWNMHSVAGAPWLSSPSGGLPSYPVGYSASSSNRPKKPVILGG